MLYRFTLISRVAFVMLLVTFLLAEDIRAQATSFFDNNWVVGISPGAASYYGDLSRYDFDPLNKIIHESGPAISLVAGKKLEKILEFGLLATFGKTSAQKIDVDMKFLNKFNEFGIYSALSIADVVYPRRKSRFDYGLMANYSITQWKSVSYKASDQGVLFSHGLDADGNKSGNGETTLHFGVGYYVAYALNARFTARLSQTMNFLNTDQFDSFVGTTNINDRLLLSGIGLIFTINPGRSPGNDIEECPTFN